MGLASFSLYNNVFKTKLFLWKNYFFGVKNNLFLWFMDLWKYTAWFINCQMEFKIALNIYLAYFHNNNMTYSGRLYHMIYVKSSYRSFSLLSSQNTILNLQSKMNRMIFFVKFMVAWLTSSLKLKLPFYAIFKVCYAWNVWCGETNEGAINLPWIKCKLFV